MGGVLGWARLIGGLHPGCLVGRATTRVRPYEGAACCAKGTELTRDFLDYVYEGFVAG